MDLAANAARALLPGRLLSRAAERIVRIGGRLFRLADLQLASHANAMIVCSSTFVLAVREK